MANPGGPVGRSDPQPIQQVASLLGRLSTNPSMSVSSLLPGGDSTPLGRAADRVLPVIGRPAAALTPSAGATQGGALPSTGAGQEQRTPFDTFVERLGPTEETPAGPAPGAAPQTVAGFDAALGIHAPVIRDMIAREEMYWDEELDRKTQNFENYLSDETANFESATTNEDKAYFQSRIFNLEQQWQAEISKMNLGRHQSVSEIMRYGLSYADQEQQQAQAAQQQQVENQFAAETGAHESFQRNLDLYGPDLQQAVGQTWAQELSAGLTDPSMSFGASGAVVQEAANLALMGQPDDALAVVGAELQRLKGVAAEDETALGTVDALNRLLARVIQAGNAVQEEGFGLLRERSGV